MESGTMRSSTSDFRFNSSFVARKMYAGLRCILKRYFLFSLFFVIYLDTKILLKKNKQSINAVSLRLSIFSLISHSTRRLQSRRSGVPSVDRSPRAFTISQYNNFILSFSPVIIVFFLSFFILINIIPVWYELTRNEWFAQRQVRFER